MKGEGFLPEMSRVEPRRVHKVRENHGNNSRDVERLAPCLPTLRTLHTPESALSGQHLNGKTRRVVSGSFPIVNSSAPRLLDRLSTGCVHCAASRNGDRAAAHDAPVVAATAGRNRQPGARRTERNLGRGR